MTSLILSQDFFDQEPVELAVALLGKVLRHKVDSRRFGPLWLSARIIETEAYYQSEKGSHSSLGYTDKRAAMFMAPGTIYMYYARGKDSLNFSARGDGNGVLIKSGYPYIDRLSKDKSLTVMKALNPRGNSERETEKLCSGQTLLCSALGLKVKDWDKKKPDGRTFRVDDVGDTVSSYVQCRRLGIPNGRDEHLMYRFVETEFAKFCTNNPLGKKAWVEGEDYLIKVSGD